MATAERAARLAHNEASEPYRLLRVRAAWVLLPLALAGVFTAQARTLSFYFFQDDYVGFSEIVTQGTRGYVWNLVTAQDLTPNWRVMTGLVYLANYKLFGMDPLPTHIVMLALHLGTVALLYRAVMRTSGSVLAAFTAALVFGLHPAYAGALGQLGGVTYMLAAFFLAATVNAAIECALARDAHASNRWLAASVVLYVLVLASNESMATMFPAIGLVFLLLDDERDLRRRVVRAAIRTAPFTALAFAAAGAFSTCGCTEAGKVYSLENAHRAFLIYMGRLAYPIGLEPPDYIDAPHLYAGIALLTVSAVTLAAGPAIGRVGVAWMMLAIVPHIFISTHTAERFTYVAAAGFALVVATFVVLAERVLRRRDARAPAIAVAAVLVTLAPWYAMQTHLQNEPWRRATSNWELLHDDLKSLYPSVPAGARVEVIGGPLVHPLDNFFVMPAMGRTMWGPGVMLQTFAADDPYVATLRAAPNPYVVEYRDGHFVRLR